MVYRQEVVVNCHLIACKMSFLTPDMVEYVAYGTDALSFVSTIGGLCTTGLTSKFCPPDSQWLLVLRGR